MKKALLLPLLLCLFLTACKEDETDPGPLETLIDVDVRKEVKAASGSVKREPATAIIHIWPAEGRDFDVEASGSDIYIGSAYDKNSGEYKAAKYGSVGSHMNEPIEPGKYFVYVVLMKSSKSGSQAYSYKYFDIKEGETLELKKTFSHDVPSETFEAWDKNQ